MDRGIITQKVEMFIMRTLNQEQINPDDNLTDLGIIHSLFSVQLIIFIEKTFKIEIDEDAFSLEDMATLNRIVDFILEKQEA